MDLWIWLQDLLDVQKLPERPFRVDENLLDWLQDIAEQEQCTPEEVAVRLLSEALQERKADEENLRSWQSLSVREQEITALTCLNFTNRQIAAHLNISPETVKTHLRNILYKLGATSKQELRARLARWDFSDWSPSPQPWGKNRF